MSARYGSFTVTWAPTSIDQVRRGSWCQNWVNLVPLGRFQSAAIDELKTNRPVWRKCFGQYYEYMVELEELDQGIVR